MPNLAKSQAQWTRFGGRELGLLWSALNVLREAERRFSYSRVRVRNLNDATSATPHFVAGTITLAGVDYGNNTAVDGTLYVRFVTNASNWDISLYTAVSASGLVAKATNVAAGAVATFAAQNSSGLTGTATLGATIAAEANDRHQLLVMVDFPARLKPVFTGLDADGTTAIPDDADSRDVFSAGFAQVARLIGQAKQVLKGIVAPQYLLSHGQTNPVARGNAFASSAETAVISDLAIPDGSGNVVRQVLGYLPLLSDCMHLEGTGGEQFILKRVPAAGVGVFPASNTGLGAVASSTPSEQALAALATFRCVKGSDTGNLGAETFDGFMVATDGSEKRVDLTGLVVGKVWSGPWGLGPLTLTRTITKTGDGSNLHLAATSNCSTVGESNSNTASGVLWWQVITNGSNWDYSFYKTSSMFSGDLVAKATNIATGATFQATQQGTSGLTVNFKAGSAPVTTTSGTLLLNPFVTQGATNKLPDSFTIAITVAASPGLIQTILAEEFTTKLNSTTSGGVTIPDTYARQGVEQFADANG